MNKIIVYGDGGCESNGTKDARAYGSFIVQTHLGGATIYQHASGRLDFGDPATNNVAEIKTFIAAIEYVLSRDDSSVISYPVLYYTDSQLVVNWLNGNWKCKQSHLVPLVEEARRLMRRFMSLSVEWVSRETIEKILGH